ncbi:peptidoglycan DD-metalloendopeptidase family protein [Vreelandella populi]|uniref:LysM peptidoglycan-binding domain-containing protein n=1 Tax=Vreelandella populi TaxID=2498858 RepID=A0A433LFN9_9GAMM|nr:peptidoglycan DD-metalloendopeptidase family protein [Halomonas populi]RUR37817.1 LysM peptidoglycan-binding domain-containing protein [Halomonas populi]RUR48726.1 LysM peptidoglycan-binding domain-containing protein [Halomonas populi]
MRKIFIMSALVLAISGCANQQHNTPQIRDLSEARRAVENSPQYTVKAGDTLYGIAWQHNLDYRQLAAMNNIDAPYQIQPGQTIALREGAAANAPSQDVVPQNNARTESRGVVATGLNPQATAVASNDQELDWLLPDESAIERSQRLSGERQASERASSQAVASAQEVASNSRPIEEPVAEVAVAETSTPTPTPAPTAEPEPEPEPAAQPAQEPEEQAVAQAEIPAAEPPAQTDRSSRTFTPADTINWQWPTDGQVTGKFGEGDSITAGIDIAGQKGQPVKAAGPGIVVYAGSGVRGYGNLILLKHNDQFLSAYAHNDSLNVSENDVVEAGEVIATMGNSDAENVRLHFEVRRDGQPQDPLTYLPSR